MTEKQIVVAVCVVLVAIFAVLFLSNVHMGPTEGVRHALAQREAEACRRVFSETPPKPAWRPCGDGDLCFHCGDARGVLQPVAAPHHRCFTDRGTRVECR